MNGGMSRACSICLDRYINTTFFPCQHQTCCSICVSKLDSLCCPVCRKSVSYVLLGCEQTSAESLSSKVSDENAGLTRKDKLSKWCLSCIVRYRQEIESYLSEKVYSVLFAGYTSHLKQLMNRFSAIVYEKVPYSEYSSNEKPQCGFSPSEIVSRVSKKLQGCPNGCLERAAIYDQEWGFSLLCAENEAEHLINGCPCRFGHCQLWELVRRLQSGERLPQLLILCFSSTLTSSFQQVVDMHNLIYRYKENYESVGLPGILWVMLDIKTKNIQSANTEVVSFEVIREKLQKIVPNERPNAVVKVSLDSETEASELDTVYRITSRLIEAHKRRTPYRRLSQSRPLDTSAFKYFTFNSFDINWLSS